MKKWVHCQMLPIRSSKMKTEHWLFFSNVINISSHWGEANDETGQPDMLLYLKLSLHNPSSHSFHEPNWLCNSLFCFIMLQWSIPYVCALTDFMLVFSSWFFLNYVRKVNQCYYHCFIKTTVFRGDKCFIVSLLVSDKVVTSSLLTPKT